jgi:hypothetical protein
MEQNMRGQCHHFADAESVISVTLVADELLLAVSKGYKILEVHEVYQHNLTLNDRDTGEGGLFMKYINMFLKLKAEASGYPSWVRSPSDEDRYIEEFAQNEGIILDKDAIGYNASKRGLAKQYLNFI